MLLKQDVPSLACPVCGSIHLVSNSVTNPDPDVSSPNPHSWRCENGHVFFLDAKQHGAGK